jgi:hypothetical protein
VFRDRTLTIGWPRLRNSELTASDWSTIPPPLSRRSSTMPRAPSLTSFAAAASTSSAAFSLNVCSGM